ncbi:hypothetical protein BDV40DRAFT_260632 [Aspergillus tamarii]|uniref:Uncharacterized protein n=1 Tax=Aspergillus tamarii TaxID=41984 RepID=A0A5N6V0L0_ASPTM|nr:hypothetical protein BDV40DRAFT_260632 [Aspergillus tamarii]
MFNICRDSSPRKVTYSRVSLSAPLLPGINQISLTCIDCRRAFINFIDYPFLLLNAALATIIIRQLGGYYYPYTNLEYRQE